MITTDQKRALSDELGKFLAKFGTVLPRKPYREDESGDGTPGLNVKSHPLLMNQPIGAASDLTAIASANKTITDAALERTGELDAKLQAQPVFQNKLKNQYSSAPVLSRL